MQKFFADFETINRFTLSLDYHQDQLECRHCLKHDQFVSHGIVYKQRSIAEVEKVGKRIFCSNRYGRSGCGRSFQLNVATKIPRLRYGAAELLLFITSLLLNLTITEAYQKATGQFESRNAWRWLDKLMAKLSSYRTGLTCLAKGNLEFIQQCQRSLPEGCVVNALRIDAAGYQTNIIRYCDDNTIEYAIRAKSSTTMKAQIAAIKDNDWEPLLDKQGNVVSGQDTYRTSYCIGDYDKPFTLIIQRKAIQGQVSLELDAVDDAEEISVGGYIYRALATNRDTLSNSQIIHWYNQRAEDSENRIKELKLDFGGDTLPCSDVNADALYFLITALSYNLFALMRQLLPKQLAHHRAVTVRWRLYAIAAKVVNTGRQWYVKLKENHRCLLEQVLLAVREFDPPPI